jgi:hypothetical protein
MSDDASSRSEELEKRVKELQDSMTLTDREVQGARKTVEALRTALRKQKEQSATPLVASAASKHESVEEHDLMTSSNADEERETELKMLRENVKRTNRRTKHYYGIAWMLTKR